MSWCIGLHIICDILCMAWHLANYDKPGKANLKIVEAVLAIPSGMMTHQVSQALVKERDSYSGGIFL